MQWLKDNWLQLHLVFVPLGTLAVTWLLWMSGGDGWRWWGSRGEMEQMGQMAPLGAAVYGSILLVIEGTGRMFWALAQREKDIEKGRQEGREKLIRELVEQGVDLPPEILREIERISRKRPRQ